MWIQVLLLLGAGLLLTLFVHQWDRVHTRAWKRVAFMLFVGANVYAVLRPQDTTWVANKLGVGRGSDLVLYGLVVGVSFMTLNTYMRFRSLEKKITDLARNVAIREAQILNMGHSLDAKPGLPRENPEAPDAASGSTRQSQL
ncbi:DUF2304 domain-containing protein [Streptomyces sp. SID3343]|uniref:DUF2304 domain-containing protein n=1 Tax=Streptomyces sp. SID3343 TaxID=2690260 RepID=UPI00136D812F|nr:DUF2304 domain-containing protein [Streptomyces sp. SID3343]MYW01600.1 DUF2304 family protein [Streptomyces sp. SID3343]